MRKNKSTPKVNKKRKLDHFLKKKRKKDNLKTTQQIIMKATSDKKTHEKRIDTLVDVYNYKSLSTSKKLVKFNNHTTESAKVRSNVKNNIDVVKKGSIAREKNEKRENKYKINVIEKSSLAHEKNERRENRRNKITRNCQEKLMYLSMLDEIQKREYKRECNNYNKLYTKFK